jgi:hypothetical protein
MIKAIPRPIFPETGMVIVCGVVAILGMSH